MGWWVEGWVGWVEGWLGVGGWVDRVGGRVGRWMEVWLGWGVLDGWVGVDGVGVEGG